MEIIGSSSIQIITDCVTNYPAFSGTGLYYLFHMKQRTDQSGRNNQQIQFYVEHYYEYQPNSFQNIC